MASPAPRDGLLRYLATRKRLWLVPLVLALALIVLLTLAFFGPQGLLDAIYRDF